MIDKILMFCEKYPTLAPIIVSVVTSFITSLLFTLFLLKF